MLATMATEAATCAVYVSLGERMAMEINAPATQIARFHEQQKNLILWARTLAVTSGLPETSVEANVELARQKMMAMLDGNADRNANVLIKRYRVLCGTVYKNAGARAMYWLNQTNHNVRPASNWHNFSRLLRRGFSLDLAVMRLGNAAKTCL